MIRQQGMNVKAPGRSRSNTGGTSPVPIDRVLVALDLSQGSRQLVARALSLPLTPNARVIALHVVPTGGKKDREAVRAAEVELERVGALDPRVKWKIAVGSAFEQIVAQAEAHRSQLIVLGRHSRKGLLHDYFVGPIAERVIRTCKPPVLVAGQTTGGAYQRPLVALDGSDASTRALDVALRIAHVDRMGVVHAFEAPHEFLYRGRMRMPPEAILAYRRKCKRLARRELEKQLSDREGAGTRLRLALRLGDPRRVILAEASKRASDLIALGTHGRSGLARMLLGSVADDILRTAPCDVLITPPET